MPVAIKAALVGRVRFTSGQNILDPVPLIVPKGVTAHLSAPNQLTAYASRDNLLGNPLIEDRL
jgi:hypothetical protein